MKWFHKKQTLPQTPAIYQLILEAVGPDGTLPQDFTLPQEDEENGLRFAAGAMDGIGIFHMAEQDTQVQTKKLAGLIEKACKHLDTSTVAEIASFLKENHVLHIVDPLIEWIQEGHTSITPDELYALGLHLMTQTSDVESVKLGIAMTGLLTIETDEVCRKAILTLGKYDEFTLYSLVAIGNWEEGNRLIFQLAQETHGWGKIHAVERLTPTTAEIRDWIIAYGCENDVLDAYLGLVCAQKGNLLDYLKRPLLSKEMLHGAGVILRAMLDEEPTVGISAYEDAAPAIEAYLRHAQNSDTLQVLTVVLELEDWLKNAALPQKDALLASCHTISAKTEWSDRIKTCITAGNLTCLWQATFAAEHLDVDIAEPLFARIQANPLEYSSYLHYICSQPAYAAKIFALYGKILPLDEIASGMGDLLGFGPAFQAHNCLNAVLQELKAYPGESLPLIKAGLGAPVVRCRNMALHVLETWTFDEKSLDDYDPTLRPLLLQLQRTEVNDSVKENIAALLSKEA